MIFSGMQRFSRISKIQEEFISIKSDHLNYTDEAKALLKDYYLSLGYS